MKYYLLFFLCLALYTSSLSQSESVVWGKYFGDSSSQARIQKVIHKDDKYYLFGTSDFANNFLTEDAALDYDDYSPASNGVYTGRPSIFSILDKDGNLEYSTFFQPNGLPLRFHDVAMDSLGNFILATYTTGFNRNSPNNKLIVTETALNEEHKGTRWDGNVCFLCGDGLLIKISPRGEVIWAGFLGSWGNEEFFQVEVLPDNSIVFGGQTDRGGLPMVGNSDQPNYNYKWDNSQVPFLYHISPDAQEIYWSTYIDGGSTSFLRDIAIVDNKIYASINTKSEKFGTEGKLRSEKSESYGTEAVIVAYDYSGNRLWDSYIRPFDEKIEEEGYWGNIGSVNIEQVGERLILKGSYNGTYPFYNEDNIFINIANEDEEFNTTFYLETDLEMTDILYENGVMNNGEYNIQTVLRDYQRGLFYWLGQTEDTSVLPGNVLDQFDCDDDPETTDIFMLVSDDDNELLLTDYIPSMSREIFEGSDIINDALLLYGKSSTEDLCIVEPGYDNGGPELNDPFISLIKPNLGLCSPILDIVATDTIIEPGDRFCYILETDYQCLGEGLIPSVANVSILYDKRALFLEEVEYPYISENAENGFTRLVIDLSEALAEGDDNLELCFTALLHSELVTGITIEETGGFLSLNSSRDGKILYEYCEEGFREVSQASKTSFRYVASDDILDIVLTAGITGRYQFFLFDITNQKVLEQFESLTKSDSEQTISINISQLSVGSYILVLVDPAGNQFTEMLILQ